MHIPFFGSVEGERAELRRARAAADNVKRVPQFPDWDFGSDDGDSSFGSFGSNGGGGGGGGGGGDDGGAAATYYSVVYVTAGSDGNSGDSNGNGHGGGGNDQPMTMGAPAAQTVAQKPTVHAPVPVPSATEKPQHSSAPKTKHSPTPTQHAKSQNTAAATSAFASPTDVSDGAASSPSSTASAEAQPQGMSAGAKAGIAIGVLIAVGLVAGLAFFAFRTFKKKRDDAEDEKQNPFSDSAAPTYPPNVQRGFEPPPVAPMADMARPSTAGTQTNPFNAPSANISTRDVASPLPAPINPFGNQAALVSQSSFNGSIPIGDETTNMTPPTPLSQHSDEKMLSTAFGGATAGVAVGAAAGAMSSQKRHEAPAALELDSRPAPPFANQGVPQSPAASAYSFTSQSGAVAAAAIAGAPPPPVSNVHRVQLDFTPSMHDELELKQGELIRMLHEYDDGWALCTKFDKSARGVCPRTCLSQKPLQPRSRNGPPPPRGPGGPGGPGLQGPPPGRTASPAPSNRGPPRPQGPASRSASPAPGPNPSMQNWPAKPTNASTITSNLSNWPAQPVNMVQRSMSPGPYGGGPQQQQRPMGPVKRRSQSVGGGPNMPKPLSMGSEEFPLPIQGGSSQSSVNRKPVPGI